jgi:hypothetical protein
VPNNEHGGTIRLHSYANEKKRPQREFAAFTDDAVSNYCGGACLVMSSTPVVGCAGN